MLSVRIQHHMHSNLEKKSNDQKLNIIELLKQNDSVNVENQKLKRQLQEGEELRDELMRTFTAEITRLKDEILALRAALDASDEMAEAEVHIDANNYSKLPAPPQKHKKSKNRKHDDDKLPSISENHINKHPMPRSSNLHPTAKMMQQRFSLLNPEQFTDSLDVLQAHFLRNGTLPPEYASSIKKDNAFTGSGNGGGVGASQYTVMSSSVNSGGYYMDDWSSDEEDQESYSKTPSFYNYSQQLLGVNQKANEAEKKKKKNYCDACGEDLDDDTATYCNQCAESYMTAAQSKMLLYE